MTLHQAATPDEARNLLPANGQPVVVLPVYNSYDDVVQCYQAFFRHTPVEVPLLVVDDGGWDRRPAAVLGEIASETDLEHEVVVLTQPHNKGFVLTMNDAFAAAGRADVVILNSDVVVGPEWLERLRAAAYSSPTIATASALTNYGTILSVSDSEGASDRILGGHTPDEAARRVAAGSGRLRPRILTAIGHCTYIRRTAFDVVGYFDPVFSPGYGEEVDFSQRAVGAGFEHVAADDVFVYHRGGGSFGRSDEVERRRYEHEQIIQNRYPYYGHWVRRSLDDDSSSLAAALLAARRSLLGLRIAVDGLCLGPLQAGTQLGIVETVRALAVRDDVTEVVLYTPTVVPSYVSDAVSSLARVTLVPKLAAEPKEPVKIIPCDVVYRGYQVREPNEIEWLRLVGERTVVNWLDLIAYYDAAYFAGDKDWRRYRDLAKLSAYTVDGLAFISEHSRQEAEHAGLLQSGVTTRIVPNGTDHTAATKAPSVAPGIAAALQPGFIFCPGVAYLHKNRVFALAVLAELDALGWKGSLVLAGANPPHGSSLAAEAEFLLKHPELSERVVSIGAFSEGEKTWLYENSGLVIYPTTSEGFGLIPFEAAFYGRACLSSRMGSLDEVLGPDVPGFTEFDPASVAKTALGLLDDEAAAATLVQQTLTRAADFTWAEAAEGVVALADEVIRRPSSRVVAIRGEAGLAGLDEFSELARNRGRRGRAAVDAMVGYFVERPALRQRIVPPNSGRQQFVRKSINVVKSKL